MEEKKSMIGLYLSLGSNIEPRCTHLEKAIISIQEKVGKVLNTSKIYETPAWGFESTPFLNACIQVETTMSTKEALPVFQHIEKQVGRLPKQTLSYEARTIDIDIIYSTEGVFKYPNLVVPHPLLQQRKFVLVPLLDIAKEYVHPLLHKTTDELLNCCDDDSEIVVTKCSE